MSDTKENILNAALRLFAHDGYEAVSVSAIAGELGITKSALYKHYKNKRDIFDSIVKKMYLIDEERSKEYDVPEEEYIASPSAYEDISAESVSEFTLAQFDFWTKDDFAANFRKMLILEQYRNKEMADLYRNCITAGPVDYMEDIFREMINQGALKNEDPKRLAVEFYAPLHLLVNISDHYEDKSELAGILKEHVKKFFEDKGDFKNEIYKK